MSSQAVTPPLPLVSLKRVSFTYPERKVLVLENIKFNIMENDSIALVGPNGAGKTTLIKIILGILKPIRGSVHLSLLRTEIGYTPQRYDISKNFPGTVREILNSVPELYKNYKKNTKVFFDLKSVEDKRFIDLSGGQQQKVLIALALAKQPKLLILDEPTSGIDAKTRNFFFKFLKNLRRSSSSESRNLHKIATLLVTHDMSLLPSMNRIIYLDRYSQEGIPKEMEFGN